MSKHQELYSPVLRKNPSGTWYIEYYIDLGGRVKRIRVAKSSDGTAINRIKNLKERETFAQKVIEELKLKLYQSENIPDCTRLSTAIEFAVGLKVSLKEKSNKSYRANARWFTEWLNYRGLSNIRCRELTPAVVQQYFDYILVKRRVGNNTYNTRKNHLRGIFTELVTRGYLPENYVSKISTRPKADTHRRPLTTEEKQAVFAWAFKHDPALAYAMLLLGYCAIRPGEIRDLKVGAIDLDKGVIRFPGSYSKNNRNSQVTIPAEIIPALEAMGRHKYSPNCYLFGSQGEEQNNKSLMPAMKRVGENTLSEKFRVMLKDLKKSGVLKDTTGLAFYSLKDSLAIYLLESGVDIEAAMQHFRHRDLAVFQRYVKRLGSINAPVRALKVDIELPE